MALTREQVAKAFAEVVGMKPREADYRMLEHLKAGPKETAEYLWDHYMGEPRVPSLETVEKEVEEALK